MENSRSDAASLERAYCAGDEALNVPRVVIVGAGHGLDFAAGLVGCYEAAGRAVEPVSIVVLDAGRLDLLGHLGNLVLPRIHLIKQGLLRVGGRTVLWGMVAPRPADGRLRRWLYDYEEVVSRFARFEKEMGGQPDRGAPRFAPRQRTCLPA